MRVVSCFVLAVALAGCGYADFTPYVGAQQEWATAPGGFVESKYAVPLYYGPPPRPYVVLGYLDATTPPARRHDAVKFAARRAQELGGDAVILTGQGQEYAGSMALGTAQTTGSYHGGYGPAGYSGGDYATTVGSGVSIAAMRGRASAVVIKWR